MSVESLAPGMVGGVSPARAVADSDVNRLRSLAVGAGLGCAVLFVVLGLGFELQFYGDGSIFAYSVAVQDSWAYHLHNISCRMVAYLFSFLPGETAISLTGSAAVGIAVYGFQQFGAQLYGLAATFLADRSKGRIIFGYACCSTACACPLVFGFPTEMWMTHAMFWPALAISHYARAGAAGLALVLAAQLVLAITHEGAVILLFLILMTLALRGLRDPAFLRGTVTFAAVMAIWLFIRMTLRPDAYIAGVLAQAGLHFFSTDILFSDLTVLFGAALAGYGMLFLLLQWQGSARAHLYAAAIVIAALAVHWIWFDHALHTENRYFMRTVLLLATAGFGTLAALYALSAEGRLNIPVPVLPRLLAAMVNGPAIRAVTGALFLVMLVHAVETAKFVKAWSAYTSAVRTLVMSTASDPALGDSRFVSSGRISPYLNRVAWNSTEPYLSVLVAPDFAPRRLMVDPAADYFWISCGTAKATERADRSIPAQSRHLVRVHACLHR